MSSICIVRKHIKVKALEKFIYYVAVSGGIFLNFSI